MADAYLRAELHRPNVKRKSGEAASTRAYSYNWLTSEAHEASHHFLILRKDGPESIHMLLGAETAAVHANPTHYKWVAQYC